MTAQIKTVIKLSDTKPGDKIIGGSFEVGTVIGVMKPKHGDKPAVLVGYPANAIGYMYTDPGGTYTAFDISGLDISGYTKFYAWTDSYEVELVERASSGSAFGWLLGATVLGGLLASAAKHEPTAREVVRVNEPTQANDNTTSEQEAAKEMSQ